MRLAAGAADADDGTCAVPPGAGPPTGKHVVSLPGGDRAVALHSEYQGGYDEILHDGKMRHKSIDPWVQIPRTGTWVRHGSCWEDAHSEENTKREDLVSKPEKQPVRHFHPRAEAAAASSAAAGPSSDNGTAAPPPPQRRPTLLPSVDTAPPPMARGGASLTFRPGEGLLLTGMDGSVEEIEPNFDLDV